MLTAVRFRTPVFLLENLKNITTIIIIFPVIMGVKLGLSHSEAEDVRIQEGGSNRFEKINWRGASPCILGRSHPGE
jgi:hypothetical protein